jgi:hypothetical protein
VVFAAARALAIHRAALGKHLGVLQRLALGLEGAMRPVPFKPIPFVIAGVVDFDHFAPSLAVFNIFNIVRS